MLRPDARAVTLDRLLSNSKDGRDFPRRESTAQMFEDFAFPWREGIQPRPRNRHLTCDARVKSRGSGTQQLDGDRIIRLPAEDRPHCEKRLV